MPVAGNWNWHNQQSTTTRSWAAQQSRERIWWHRFGRKMLSLYSFLFYIQNIIISVAEFTKRCACKRKPSGAWNNHLKKSNLQTSACERRLQMPLQTHLDLSRLPLEHYVETKRKPIFFQFLMFLCDFLCTIRTNITFLAIIHLVFVKNSIFLVFLHDYQVFCRWKSKN